MVMDAYTHRVFDVTLLCLLLFAALRKIFGPGIRKSTNVQSSNFHPCDLVRQWPVLQCPVLQFPPSLYCLPLHQPLLLAAVACISLELFVHDYVTSSSQHHQGRIYSKQGTVQKKCGAPPGAADPIFPEKNWRPFFGHHCRFYSFHSFTRVSPIIFGMQKIAAPLVGPLFVGPLFGRTC